MSPISRGGRRQGTPGKNYSVFRSDLNQNRAPSAASAPPTAPPSGTQPAAPTQTAAPPAVPPQLKTFAPTAYPHLPVTHGLPSGPGAGPEVLQPRPMTPAEDYMGQLRAIYLQNPTEALRSLIEFNSNGAS